MKLLFSAANNILDRTSGAAISVRTLLRLLGDAGVEARSLTGSIYDRPEMPTGFENMESSGAVPTDPGAPLTALWVAREGQVVHNIVPTARTGRVAQSPLDEGRIFDFAQAELDAHPPDVLMVYGAGLYERSLVRVAKERNIVTVFYLAHPGYKERTAFQSIDQIFTDTAATRDLYRQRLGLQPYAIGKFVDPPVLPGGPGHGRFTLFVNPAFEKGVTLFYRIAELAHATFDDLRFLVVESRSSLEAVEGRTGMKFSALPNIERVGIQPDIGAVMARSRVLLMPALWHESGARIAIEACSAGIPTVATDRGGLPEVLGDSGILIPPPPPLVEENRLIPPISEAIPWVEALRALYEDDEFYAERSAAALQQWVHHDPARRIQDIIAILSGLVAKARP